MYIVNIYYSVVPFYKSFVHIFVPVNQYCCLNFELKIFEARFANGFQGLKSWWLPLSSTQVCSTYIYWYMQKNSVDDIILHCF